MLRFACCGSALYAAVAGEALLLLERVLLQASEEGAAPEADGETQELEVPSLRRSHLQLYYKPPPSMLQPLCYGPGRPESTEGGSTVPHQHAAAGSVQTGPGSRDCTWAPPRQWSREVSAAAAVVQTHGEVASNVLWPQLLQAEGGHVSHTTAQHVLTHKLDRSADAAAVAVLGRLFGQQAASLCCNPTL